MISTGAVAFGIVSLLPVELILQVGSSAGFAMVFALLIAAIIWNLGHLVFRSAGLEFAHPDRVDHRRRARESLARGQDGTSGVDWGQATEVGKSLLFSPIVGFALGPSAAPYASRDPHPALYKAPEGDEPPPWWIRGLLVLTCTGVSFAHGSNDGQKGMGLIMLILIGIGADDLCLEPLLARQLHA